MSGDIPDSAVALAQAIRTKRISCVEVMTATLDRIERVNPKVNAIVAMRPREALLAEARARDDDIAHDRYRGALHGFPQSVKDLEAMRDLPTSMGFAPFRNVVAPADSIMVERMRNNGAIFIGRTNTPEFGLGSHTFNKLHGATRNAYDLSKSAGGSSGGAAVALALRLLPVADGSDYGGSLRNPAGWNNIFALRPSIGRIPSVARGGDVWLPSMGVAGPMARNIADLALLFAVQAGYDDRAPLSIDAPLDLEGLDRRDLRGAPIAWSGDMGGYLPFEAGVLDTCRNALKVFADIGCIVEEANPDFPIDTVWRAWLVLRAWQAGSGLLPIYNNPAWRQHMKPEAVFEVEQGAKLSAFDISTASAIRSQWYEAVRQFLTRYDYWILPTAQLFPFDVDLDWPKEIAGHTMTTYHEWMKVVLPVTMSGCPTLAVPAGFGPTGLPIGLQIVAPNHRERACLELGLSYEQRAPWLSKRPPLIDQARTS
ncbi:MAG: amidase [Alphaproteobacteria bacterium]|nr:amidase [Alphaproteobacteria bacterium]